MISQWEKGVCLPSTLNLFKLASLYQIMVDALFIDFLRALRNELCSPDVPKKPLRIIGINPGTRYIGVAIFQGTELRDWQVKNIAGNWSKEKIKKARMIVSGLIEQYEPDALAIKRFHPSRSSKNLNRLAEKIKGLAKSNGLKVYQYSIKELENFFSSEERINKKELIEIIVSKYPFLSYELEKEKAHKNPYYIRMFEAVALGSICFNRLDRICQNRTQKF